MSAISELIANLDDEGTLAEVKKQLDNGIDPLKIFAECQEGMNQVGKRFQEGEYYVSDLMMSGAIFKEVSDLISPYMTNSEGAKVGKVVLGTVQGDIHDIGKDLVKAMMTAGNIEVVDVGVDASPDTFVTALKENPDVKVLALSCLLTTCYDSIKATVEAVKSAGLNNVKIVIGGGPVDQSVVEYSQADRFGKDAQEAVSISKELMGL